MPQPLLILPYLYPGLHGMHSPVNKPRGIWNQIGIRVFMETTLSTINEFFVYNLSTLIQLRVGKALESHSELERSWAPTQSWKDPGLQLRVGKVLESNSELERSWAPTQSWISGCALTLILVLG